MANPYPIEIADADSGVVRLAGAATFTDSNNQPGGGFNGGTMLAEVTANITLVSGVQSDPWTFDAPVIDTADGDVSLGVDMQTFTFNATGWYQLWYSLAIHASATTLKSQVQSYIDGPADPLNWIRQGSLAELQLHLNGADSLGDLTVTFMAPPVHFTSGDAIKFRTYGTDTAGSVGDAIVTSNTYVSIVRIA